MVDPKKPLGRPEEILGELINWKWSLALGVLSVIGGVIALLNPFLASLTAESVLSVTLLILGIMQIWMAFAGKPFGGENRIWVGLLGLVFVLFAISLMYNPLSGLASLTLIAATLFLAMGVLRVILALRMRAVDGWVWLLGAGLVSILLGILILVSFPKDVVWLIGMLLGIDLVFSGMTMIVVAMRLRDAK